MLSGPCMCDQWLITVLLMLFVDLQGILFFDRMTMDVLETVREELKVSTMWF